MNLDKNTVRKISNLARLEITALEEEALLQDMNNILGFMDKLNEVDTSGVEPLVYLTDEVNVFRPDEVRKESSVQEALQNAPLHDDSYFKVAKMINK
jgi:aspartyl-tRNA(Asn)/glutamyl-tRNA(Gln) amidotransferase subunit C